MKDEKNSEFNRKNILPVIYIMIAIIATVIVVFLLISAREFILDKKYKGIIKIFAPFTFGFIIAYLLNPLFIFFEDKVFVNIGKIKTKNNDDNKINKKKKLKNTLSLLSTYAITLLLITLLMLMVVPQVSASLSQLAVIVTDLFNPYEYDEDVLIDTDRTDENSIVASEHSEENPIIGLDIDIDRNSLSDTKIGVYVRDFTASVQSYIDNWGIDLDIEEKFNDFFLNSTANIVDLSVDYIQPAFNATASLVAGTASLISNILLGIIISVYMLANKDNLIAQVKKLFYAIFSESFSHKAVSITRKTHEIFGGFLTGKILDSFIIGVICFICMTIFNINFAMLISIIVGITNMIPFFGPFIGAIPSIFFLLIYDGWQAVWFTVFILILQQFDGNFLGPKVLGSKIGLSPLWIIFAVLVMNGLFGIVGMFIGVPLFAIIYTLVKEFAEHRLDKKGLPVETEAYISSRYTINEIRGNKAVQLENENQESFFNKIEYFFKNFDKIVKFPKKGNKEKDDSNDDGNNDEDN